MVAANISDEFQTVTADFSKADLGHPLVPKHQWNRHEGTAAAVISPPASAGAAAIQQHSVFLLKQGEHAKLEYLTQPRCSIGRQADNHIQLPSRLVSRYHATLCKIKNDYWIFDGDMKGLVSTNGLIINGKRYQKYKLKSGDVIHFAGDIYAIFLQFKGAQESTTPMHHTNAIVASLLAEYKNRSAAEANNKAIELFSDLILYVDSTGKIKYLKESEDAVLSMISREYVDRNISTIFSYAVNQRILKSFEKVLKNHKPEKFDCAVNIEEKNIYCELRIVSKDNNSFIIAAQNITERKEAEQKITYDAYHDSLTGLPNRSSFIDKVENSIKFKKKFIQDYKFFILFIDLDRFKMVNDSLGHLIGDRYLIEIAKRLKASVKISDMVARLGGDEFAILLERVEDIDAAIEITKRLQEEISKPLYIDQHEFFPGASIGIASSQMDYDNVEEILRDADTAMYQAKSSGRSRFDVFDQNMHHRAKHQLELDSDLRRAIKKEEFQLYYQPIFALKENALIGFETLIRWQHPDRGLVGPDQFIAEAEEKNLISEMSQWVFREACRQLREWREAGIVDSDLTINVNLSPKEFSNPQLAETLKAILDSHCIPAKNLNLEVTENIFMGDALTSAAVLKKLREIGLKIYIDDFGTGYSSLSYLHRFPIDALKIDRSFIAEISQVDETSSSTIVHSIIGLAHNLGVKVIAEGIENDDHLVYLKASGCDYGQGYLFSKPLKASQVERLVQQSRVRFL
jgi:diguanylate cyclase (GGDEF)-like protein